MGTTYDALVSDDNVSMETTIAIEGYSYVLTTGSASAAVTAYSGTDWSQALSGLSVFWKLSSDLNPWEPFRGNQGSLSFAVADVDGSDRFGIDANRKEPDDLTQITATVEPDEATTVSVLSTSGFDSNGDVHIGCEAITFDSSTGTTFTDITRGKYSPYTTAAGDRYARRHRLNSTIPGINLAPDVTNIPIDWVGKWVAVRLHRNVGGTLDTVAQSHLAYAGRIASIRESEDGQTFVECEHVLDVIANTAVFREPWRANLREGVWLRQGVTFALETSHVALGVGSSAGGSAGQLLVVSSGASGAYEIDEGFYNAAQVQFFINRWMADAYAASDTVLATTFTARANTTEGVRSAVGWGDADTNSAVRIGTLKTNASWVAQFFGWDQLQLQFGGISTTGTNYGANEPTRIATIVTDATSEVEYVSEQGSWFDQSAYLPTVLAAGTFTKGIVKVGGAYYIAATPAAGVINLRKSDVLNKLAGVTPGAFAASGTGVLEIQQVLVLEGSFFGQFLAFLLSTGATGFNSSSWDLFPEHVGIGIPYSILSSDFETEFAIAPGASIQRTVIIEKPTLFADLFEWAFTVRHMQLVWGNGRLSLTGWATPTSGASLTVTESMKHTPVGQQDKAIAVSEQSDRWLRNVIKIDYDRLPFQETYQSSYTIDHKKSQNANGGRPITIKARDAVSANGLLGERLSAVLPSFIAGLSFLTRPVHLVKVPISFSQFITHRPGQSVLFTDTFLRDPTSGERGVTGKPALIVGSWYDWGGGTTNGKPRAPQGELTLMLFPGRQIAQYCPAADIDESVSGGGFSAGYNSGVPSVRLKTHAYSESADANDATRFDANDVVVIVEKDPSDPAAPLTWTRTLVSRSTDDWTLSSTLTSPAFDSTKTYRMYSATYTSAQTSQQSDCYQADDADGSIADTRAAYAYAYFGAGQVSSYTAAAATTLPERHVAAAYGDGKALDTGNAFVIAKNLNNLISYPTAPQCPVTYSETGGFGSPAGSQNYAAVRIEIVHVGKGIPQPTTVQRTRILYVAPIFYSTDGSTAEVRMTLMRDLPATSDAGVWDVDRPVPYIDYSWTTTSTTNTFQAAVNLDTSHLRLGDEPMGGLGYLLVEVSAKAVFVGFSEMYVGPLEDA